MFSNDSYTIGTVLGLAFLFSLICTPLFRDIAQWIGLVDRPDGRRKHQHSAIPRAGGLAIFVAMTASISGVAFIALDFNDIFRLEPRLGSLLGAAAIIAVVGILDDARGLRGRHKLLGQFIAISLLVYCGHLSIETISLFGVQIELGPLGVVVTYLWMIGIINAINLIDGMDGLLGLIGILICVSLAVIAVLIGNAYVAIVSVALAGALLGFLCFNLPPATVYLGDCGSMLIGLVIGSLAIQGSLKGPTAMTLAVPMAVLILPLIDTLAAIARRKLTGRSIYTTDRGHLHHCLLRSGMNRPLVLMLVLVLGMIASAGAVATIMYHNDIYAVAAAGVVVILLMVTRLFGHAEFMLMKGKFSALLALMRHGGEADRSHQLEVRLQGSVKWQAVWDDLTSAALQYDLRTICLNVNAPALHENYHARWDRFGVYSSSEEEPHEWKAELPITMGGQVIGRVSATGVCTHAPVWIVLQQLADMIKNTVLQVHRLAEEQSTVTKSRENNTPMPIASAIPAGS
ncbi:MAG: undecaprenyl/decaprenyl-phosphate alpha-N-acetylglucosaminyl 1-phosphate transferase [Planctomycetes bacterium]|nr:undecaprenyl/decaprenyl-phosphate alpha-N-acetylglucosaminyl 1-phosphate transferase [Planctomycetota bacterium]